VEVGHDVVTVITQRAIPVEKLDLAAARAEFEKVQAARATGPEAIDAKLDAAATARAVVRAAARGR